MDRFPHTQGLAGLVERLEQEASPIERDRLQRELLRKGDHLGGARERIREVDHLITAVLLRLGRQRDTVAHLAADGEDVTLARDILCNLEQTLALLVGYHRRQVWTLDPEAPVSD
jgi:hypothetical protein